MANAARAYQDFGYIGGTAAPARTRTGGVRVHRNKTAVQAEPIAVSQTMVAACAIVLTVVVTLFALLHVTLDNAAVTLSLNAQQISTQISDAKHEATNLQVQASSLANPQRIKTAAAELGMSSASNATVIYLSKDIVSTNAAGNLSLSQSMRVVAESTITG